MPIIEDKIVAHYKTRSAMPGDDHMHIGGKKATAYFSEKMGFKAGESVLDIGCGLGGPARYIAEHYQARVTGLDLSPDNIDAARALSRGLDIQFDLGNGKDLPYAKGSFDAALMMHVGMNIADKGPVYKAVHTVLKQGGRLGIYDIMSMPAKPGALRFPLPWAEDMQTSFLEAPDVVEGYIQNAGFRILEKENRHDFALTSLGHLLENAEITLPDERRSLLSNLRDSLQEGLCAPYIFIAERLE